MGETDSFHRADYAVFVASLVLTLVVGVYFAYTGRKKKTTEEFLLGSRTMHWIPVSLSLTASNISGIMILGITAETHYFGTMSSALGLGYLFGGIFVIAVYIPVLHKMKVTSVHEVCTGNKLNPSKISGNELEYLHICATCATSITCRSLVSHRFQLFIWCDRVSHGVSAFKKQKIIIFFNNNNLIIAFNNILKLYYIHCLLGAVPICAWTSTQVWKLFNFN